MSFEEVKNVNNACAEEHANTVYYDEDGDLLVDVASEIFCSMDKDQLLAVDHSVLADVIIDSREVLTKATEVEYVAVNLLAACLTALVNKEPNLTKLFTSLTSNGTRNMTTEELTELMHGFTFAKNKELNTLMALDKMIQ